MLGYFKIMRISPALKRVPAISVCMDIDTANKLRVLAAVVMPGTCEAAVPVMQMRMPMVGVLRP